MNNLNRMKVKTWMLKRKINKKVIKIKDFNLLVNWLKFKNQW